MFSPAKESLCLFRDGQPTAPPYPPASLLGHLHLFYFKRSNPFNSYFCLILRLPQSINCNFQPSIISSILWLSTLCVGQLMLVSHAETHADSLLIFIYYYPMTSPTCGLRFPVLLFPIYALSRISRQRGASK